MRSILIKDTTREERIRIVHQALWAVPGAIIAAAAGQKAFISHILTV